MHRTVRHVGTGVLLVPSRASWLSLDPRPEAPPAAEPFAAPASAPDCPGIAHTLCAWLHSAALAVILQPRAERPWGGRRRAGPGQVVEVAGLHSRAWTSF